MGAAIPQQTWAELGALTWDNLSSHQWMDFRMVLSEGIGEVEAQGVTVVNNGADIEALAEAVKLQGVRVEFGLSKISNEVEIIVSISISKKDYYNTMLRYMPTYHHGARITNELLKVYAKDFKRLEFEINDQEENQFIDSTVSKIDRWEKALGIVPDKTKPYDFRRERVKSKLRAVGTATKAMIQNVAAAFSGGEVDVIEDNANYKFIVKFTGTKGIPPNMDDLTEILEEIKPAHLAFEYSYTYNTWSLLSAQIWGGVSGMTWNELQTF